jgi:hypothetical protein
MFSLWSEDGAGGIGSGLGGGSGEGGMGCGGGDGTGAGGIGCGCWAGTTPGNTGVISADNNHAAMAVLSVRIDLESQNTNPRILWREENVTNERARV